MSASPDSCPPPEQLRDFTLGVISEAEASWIADHLDVCGACEETVDRLDLSGDTLVNALLAPPETDEFAGEPGCRRVESLALEIGAELPGGPTGQPGMSFVEAAAPAQIGPYRIVERIGAGGMGAVYKAVHTRLDRVVALKLLPAERTQNASAVARFEREMRAIGKLDHPHIVRATDAGEAEGVHYLVMELVDGLDLATVVQGHGPLSVPDACEAIRQAALGLQEAHRHGMVHRDIKPSNLMLARSPRPGEPPTVKVLDLGLALLGEDHGLGQVELTSQNQVVGTIDYLPPEQLADTHHVDIRADIYSLGATLYKLLTGDVPFPSSQYPTLLKKLSAIANASIPRVETRRPDVPGDLGNIVARMLSRDRAQRFATPQEVATVLLPFCAGHRLSQLLTGQELDGRPRPPTNGVLPATQPITRPPEARRRKVILSGLGVAGVAALLAVIIITIKRPDGTETVIELPPQVDATITQGSADEGPRVELRPAPAESASAPLPSTANDTATEANRRAVAWALAVGGKVTLLRGEQRFPISSPLVQPSPGDLLEIDLNQLKIVDDAAIENLKDATAIQTLAINSTSVSSLDFVNGLINLQVLNCSIDILDADDLRTLIPHKSLRTLAVGIFDSPRPSTEATAAAFEAACGLPQLTTLLFGSLYYPSESRYYPLEDASLSHLQRMPQLETLHLGSSKLTNDGLLALPSLPNLSWFAIGCPLVTGRGLARLSDFPKLEVFVIRGSKLTDADLELIQSPPCLKRFWFYHCSELTGTGLAQLDCLPRLTSLKLNYMSVTDEGLAALSNAGSQLQTLELMNSPQITNAGLESLVKLQHLQDLDISGCSQITDDAVSTVARMPSLKIFGAAQTGISNNGVAALKKARPGIAIRIE